MSDQTILWLRGLAEKGGKGVVNNIDARNLGRIADELERLRAGAAATPASEPYLVWSNQHRCWWRANSQGYTTDIRAAGHYSREEAISISGQSRDGWGDPSRPPDELAIPISALPKNILALVTRPLHPSTENTAAGEASTPPPDR